MLWFARYFFLPNISSNNASAFLNASSDMLIDLFLFFGSLVSGKHLKI